MGKKNEYIVPETNSETITELNEINKNSNIKEKPKECMHYIYIGPSVPNGRLKNGVVFNGTMDQIKTYLEEDLSAYPTAEKLIVPIPLLAEAQAKVKSIGNSYNKHYNDTAALIAAEKKED